MRPGFFFFEFVKRKRTSREAAKEKTASHSPFHCWPSASLRCSKKVDASESREVYAPLRGARPSRFSTFYSTAWLREMAFGNF